MDDLRREDHYHGTIDSHGGHQFINSPLYSEVINFFGHVSVRAVHVRIARRILEVFEFLLCIMILGITGSASVGMTSDLGFAGTPGKLKYNIGVAAFTLIKVLVTIPIDFVRPSLLGYDKPETTREPWFRIALNILLTGLWIGTIPASFYTCGDLCSAANFPGGGSGSITFATLSCECFGSQSISRRLTARGTEQRTGRYEATEGLDILLTIVFLFTTALLIASRFVREQQRTPYQTQSQRPATSQIGA